MYYRCIRTFTSTSTGITYYFGNIVPESVYKMTAISQQRNFVVHIVAEQAHTSKRMYK